MLLLSRGSEIGGISAAAAAPSEAPYLATRVVAFLPHEDIAALEAAGLSE
jgi:hypothetical protein